MNNTSLAILKVNTISLPSLIVTLIVADRRQLYAALLLASCLAALLTFSLPGR
jgi:hypothetical protein